VLEAMDKIKSLEVEGEGVGEVAMEVVLVGEQLLHRN